MLTDREVRAFDPPGKSLSDERGGLTVTEAGTESRRGLRRRCAVSDAVTRLDARGLRCRDPAFIRAVIEFRRTYNTTRLIERHGFRPPDAIRTERPPPAVLAA